MRQILKGSVNQSVTVRMWSPTTNLPVLTVDFNTPGLLFYYRREAGLVVNVPLVALASADAPYRSGGIEHLFYGYYRFDVPNAAFATGANDVIIGGACPGAVIVASYHELTEPKTLVMRLE